MSRRWIRATNPTPPIEQSAFDGGAASTTNEPNPADWASGPLLKFATTTQAGGIVAVDA